jgi:hypothetical protein
VSNDEAKQIQEEQRLVLIELVATQCFAIAASLAKVVFTPKTVDLKAEEAATARASLIGGLAMSKLCELKAISHGEELPEDLRLIAQQMAQALKESNDAEGTGNHPPGGNRNN